MHFAHQEVPNRSDDDCRERMEEIKAILGRGNIARFHYKNAHGVEIFYKDVNKWDIVANEKLNQDELHSDLKSFNRSGGATEWICWWRPELRIEEIAP